MHQSHIYCSSFKPAQPRPTALLLPRSNGKPEAATAVYKLLIMGLRMPETCWAVFKRQAIILRDWCIWLVDLLECGVCVVRTKGKVLVLASDMLQAAILSKNSTAQQWTFQVSQNGVVKTQEWADGFREFERRLDRILLARYVTLAAQQSDRDGAGCDIIRGYWTPI
jgi:hypothetical protein